MNVSIKPLEITIRPGVVINTMAALRSVLEDRPMGGTVGDYRKAVRLLDQLDAVAAGTLEAVEVNRAEAKMLADLLENQRWQVLCRPLMSWLVSLIDELRNLAKEEG